MPSDLMFENLYFVFFTLQVVVLEIMVPKQKKGKKCAPKAVHPMKEAVTSQGKVIKGFNIWNVSVEWEMPAECDWISDDFYLIWG